MIFVKNNDGLIGVPGSEGPGPGESAAEAPEGGLPHAEYKGSRVPTLAGWALVCPGSSCVQSIPANFAMSL